MIVNYTQGAVVQYAHSSCKIGVFVVDHLDPLTDHHGSFAVRIHKSFIASVNVFNDLGNKLRTIDLFSRAGIYRACAARDA